MLSVCLADTTQVDVVGKKKKIIEKLRMLGFILIKHKFLSLSVVFLTYGNRLKN